MNNRDDNMTARIAGSSLNDAIGTLTNLTHLELNGNIGAIDGNETLAFAHLTKVCQHLLLSPYHPFMRHCHHNNK
jgi:Ran GTPase-activating protein (RanGAP) involved in mRNA processing and transport